MTKTCTICVVSGERVDNRERAELFEALLRDSAGFIDDYLVEQGDYSSVSLEENAAKLFGRIKIALSASPAEVAAMLREMAEGGE